MNPTLWFRSRLTALLLFSPLSGLHATDETANPSAGIDPATGHKVVRLYRGQGSSSCFYFHQNPFVAAGDKFVFSHGNGLYCLDFTQGAEPGAGRVAPLVQTRIAAMPVVAPIGRNVYYIDSAGRTISSTNLDTLKTRVIAALPTDWDLASESISGLTVNSDETLLAGVESKGLDAVFKGAPGTRRQDHIDAAFKAHLPAFLFTVDIKTGRISQIQRGNDWCNHVQFSPADPRLLMFAHEGPWRQLDRIWLIHSDGTGLTNVHPRKFPDESYGHEFWSPDGTVIWSDYFDGKSKSLVGNNIITGKVTGYPIGRDQVSRHYNISHDGKFFVGDGEPNNPTPMIILLIPQPNGTLLTKPLCSIARNDFLKKEPNVRFSPDDKWVIFSSTQSGETQAYAVRVAD